MFYYVTSRTHNDWDGEEFGTYEKAKAAFDHCDPRKDWLREYHASNRVCVRPWVWTLFCADENGHEILAEKEYSWEDYKEEDR